MTTNLVVGRGLLGRAVIGELVARRQAVHTVEVPWGWRDRSLRALRDAAGRAAATDDDWRLVWTAGAGVIASDPAELEQEAGVFNSFLEHLDAPPAALFLASSAGGVYAGSPDQAPFTEESRVGVMSPYGRTKLAMEAAAWNLADQGSRVLLGRLANLYGPGQNLSKPQGLVSQLCLTHLTRQPLKIYASMDSLRDYIYVVDAATKIVGGLDLLASEPAGQVVVKIVASGTSRSVGSVIGESTRAFRKRPNLVIRGSSGQVMDLRLRSRRWPILDDRSPTPFVVGLRATAADIEQQMLSSSLTRAMQ